MTRRDLISGMASLAIGLSVSRMARADDSSPPDTDNPNDRFPDTTTSRNLHYWYPLPPPAELLDLTFDICIYGATPAGVSAAIQARRMGRTAVLLSFDR